MKNIYVIFALTIAGYSSYGQTNTLPTSGRVGIGTTTPLYPLTVVSTSNAFCASNGTQGVLLQGQKSSLYQAGGIVGYYNGIYNDLDIRAKSITGSQLYLKTSGDVGIGTMNPDAKLAVNGTIHSKEVKVDLAGWPDYVFKPAYQLPSLAEVKSYIDKNQHLPGMPSQREIEKNGLNLGEMNKQLTLKIEELTLYLLEKDKKDKEKDAQLSSQQEQINQLKGQLSILMKTLNKN